MSDMAVREAVAEFYRYMQAETARYPEGTVFRAGGRASKQYPNKEDGAWWQEHGPAQVEAWVKWRAENPNLQLATIEGVPAIEVGVEYVFGDVHLRGFIDRIFQDQDSGELLIVDLKTGRTTPGSPLQLDFYRLALQRSLGITATYGAYWMSRQGSLSNIHTLNTSLERIEDWLTDAASMIRQNLFIPHVTSMCGSCGVKDFCTALNPQN